jgi:two-component system sensor histidine kinase DesK
MVTFVVAFAMFTLPLATALGIGVAGIGAAVVVPLSLGVLAETWFFVPIVLMVGVSTAVVRVLEQRGAEHQQMAAEMALVAERERVARDVHDVLGHSLTVVTVKAELAQRLVDADPERAKAELAHIQSLTREALAEIRATVAGLRVARLADELKSAAAALADAGVAADLPVDPSIVDPRHRIVLAWVLREAVTNVVRHSAARRCTVEMGSSTLSVTDDGRGLADCREGNGLQGVRERVAGAGGTLSVGPGPAGRGTTVRVKI